MAQAVRVLVVAPAPLSDDWAGGISNFVRSFVAHMPTDFSVSIAGVAGRDDELDGGWRELSLAGRDVRFLPVARIRPVHEQSRLPVKARAMLGLLRARPHLPTNGTVVQLHAPAMDLPLALRPAPMIRVVHNAPDNLASSEAGTLWRRSAWALRAVEQHGFERADRVFFVDRATYEHYSTNGNGASARMCYLPNGVDTDAFAPRNALEREAARHALSAQLGVPETGKWLLFCGRLDRQKDPELLVRTFAAVRRLPDLNDAQLVVVGDGPLKEDAWQAARAAGVAGAVHFVGTIEHDKLPQVMGASDALLLTSAYEGAPFVVLEALACGLPVVSTAVGDVPALVEHEHTGWLAESRSADELARGVAWAAAQSRDVIAPRAAASMQPYRIEEVLKPFYEAHRKLAAEAKQ
jgi:glycosyltransferase involved in cell wall biosynthesis